MPKINGQPNLMATLGISTLTDKDVADLSHQPGITDVSPIMFVTGVEENRWLEEAFDAGADDLITKPPNIFIIRARLKGHLQRMEYFQRLEAAATSMPDLEALVTVARDAKEWISAHALKR